MDCRPAITMIFSNDADEWDEYLTQCFNRNTDNSSLRIVHQRLENINFPLSNYEIQNFSNSRAVLLILSPDLLDFIDANAEVFELTRLLNPKRTVVMLCGVQQSDVSAFHRAALASYDQWTCLVAKDQDKEFVENIIETVLQILQTADNCTNKPQFKLTPRKAKEGSGKVFVLLETPISSKQQIDILVDGSNESRVAVKWKNPYNLYFIIPDDMLRVARVVNISLVVDNKHFLGTRPLKCETKMSELHTLLASVNSPFEFMCQTLGFATHSQVDRELANRFEHRLTHFGSLFLSDIDIIEDKTKSSHCYLPTLLHFAAAYGLRELTSKLLHCPMAYKACQWRNSDNLTPAQLARHLNHSDIGALLDDFQRLCETERLSAVEHHCRQRGRTELTDQEKANLKRNVTALSTGDTKHHHLYGLTLYSDLQDVKNIDQLSDNKNNAKSKQSLESNEYEYVKQGLSGQSHAKSQSICSPDSESPIDGQIISDLCGDRMSQLSGSDHNGHYDVDHLEAVLNDMSMSDKDCHQLSDSHTELIAIIDQFKRGIAFDKFETIFDNWQKKYCNVLDPNATKESKELNESLAQIKSLCQIGRKHQEFENNKHSLNFNDLRYYLTSKLNNRLNDNSLKRTLHHRLEQLSLTHLSYPDSLNSYSSSTATNDSSIDGTLQTTKSLKSSNESQGFNRRHNQNNYYKRLKTKVFSLVDRQSEPQTNAKQSDLTHKPITSGPPAPPPRPLTVGSISETNNTNDFNFNELRQTENDSDDGLYYSYHKSDKSIDFKSKLTHHSSQSSLKSAQVNGSVIPDERRHSKMQSNIHPIKSNSMSERIGVSHEYVNVAANGHSSPAAAVAKRDPLIDYDLVPSGIPVPIDSLRAKAILCTKPLNPKEYEYDYDIPRVPKWNRNKRSDKQINENKECDESDKKQKNTIETELQIFV